MCGSAALLTFGCGAAVVRWGPAQWKLQDVLFPAKLLKRAFQFYALGEEKGTNSPSRAPFPAPSPCAWLVLFSRDGEGYSVSLWE